MMRIIERAEVVVTSPERNFVTLRLTTSNSLIGLGDGTLNGRDLAVVSDLKQHVCPLLLSKDATQWAAGVHPGDLRRRGREVPALSAAALPIRRARAQVAVAAPNPAGV